MNPGLPVGRLLLAPMLTMILMTAKPIVAAELTEHEQLDPPALTDPDLPPRAGAFVSLHSRGQLLQHGRAYLPLVVLVQGQQCRGNAEVGQQFPAVELGLLRDVVYELPVAELPRGRIRRSNGVFFQTSAALRLYR